jgi:hypothetical protein
MCCQSEEAVEPLDEHAPGFQRLVSKEWALFVGKGKGDKVGDGVGA